MSVNLQEDRGVTALPAQVVRHCHQEATEYRKQHRDVMRLPGLLKHNIKDLTHFWVSDLLLLVCLHIQFIVHVDA